MKIIASLFLMISICIVAVIGVTALQSQTDIGDSVITEFSENSDTYDTIKDSTALTATTMSYAPYFMLISMLAALGASCMGIATYLKYKI